MKRARAFDGSPVLRFANGLELRIGNIAAAAFLCALLAILAMFSIGAGMTETGLGDMWRLLAGKTISENGFYALATVRLPRMIEAFMAGWCVALAGAMLQSIARNPLADPGLFGLSQGSMTMIMLLLVFMPEASKPMTALAALGGGIVVALLLMWLAGGERSSGLAILLMGIAIEALLSAITSVLVLYTPPDISLALADWMAGSLFKASWNGVAELALPCVASLIGIIFAGRALRVYEFGNDIALSLGEPLRFSRPLILIFAVFLSSSAVTAVGPLMFLGVIAPQLAGLLTRANGRMRIFLAALTGGILVVAADTGARALGGAMPLPLGLGLTLIGVPLFILALRLQAFRRLQLH